MKVDTCKKSLMIDTKIENILQLSLPRMEQLPLIFASKIDKALKFDTKSRKHFIIITMEQLSLTCVATPGCAVVLTH